MKVPAAFEEFGLVPFLVSHLESDRFIVFLLLYKYDWNGFEGLVCYFFNVCVRRIWYRPAGVLTCNGCIKKRAFEATIFTTKFSQYLWQFLNINFVVQLKKRVFLQARTQISLVGCNTLHHFLYHRYLDVWQHPCWSVIGHFIVTECGRSFLHHRTGQVMYTGPCSCST